MKTIEAKKIKKATESDSRNLRGTEPKKSASPKNLIDIFIESALTGFSLFMAFIIEKTFLDFQHHQFPFGIGELIRMSAGISFCYAFIAVLRRGHLNRYQLSGKDFFRQVSRYAVETYVLFLALLFLVNDISMKSTRLALGFGLVLSIAVLFLYRLIASTNFFATKSSPYRRKIVLKKSAPPAARNDRSRLIIDEEQELPAGSDKNPGQPVGRLEKNIDDSLRESERYYSRHYSKNPKNQD